MRDILARLLLEFYERIPIPLVKRRITPVELPGKISAIIGMRRVGKTYLIYQKIQELLETEVQKTSILYLNLEDDRLPVLEKGVLGQFIDAFYELYPQNHRRHTWIFLDEVQNAPDWPQVLRRLLDTKDTSLFVTGSSAKLLSKEIATSLRGRAIATEVWPFDIYEYASASLQEIPVGDMSPRQKDEFLALINQYLLTGGFPETIGYNDLHRTRVHEDYVSVAILRDILERHEIKNEHILRYLIKFLLTNISRPISLHKLFNDLKSQGRSLGKNTLYQYFEHVSDCYLSFLVPLFTDSSRKQESNPRKSYCVDTGLARSHMFAAGENMGKLFENLLYLDFRRSGYAVHYYLTQSGKEVDFVARSIEGKTHLIQACFDMSDPETIEREKSALIEAETELAMRGTIVTRDNYREFLDSLG
jgi:predicted AAA+ superfamily ATPase